MSRVILVASGKGGTGKTTVAAALACALCDAGRRVLALDLDSGLGNLDLALGMHDAALFSVKEVLSGAVSLDGAATPVHARPGLRILTAPPAGYVPPERELAAFCANLRAADTDVILDCGAGMGDTLMVARAVADLGLVVSLTEAASLRDAAMTAGALSGRDGLHLRLVCNRVPKERRWIRRHGIDIDACMDAVGLPLAAVIFEDEKVKLAGTKACPLADIPRSTAAADIRALAQRIIFNKF